MKIKLLAIIIFLQSTLITSAHPATADAISSNMSVKITRIIETTMETENLVKMIKNNFPHIEIGQTYNTVFQGVAVSGDKSQIKRLESKRYVKNSFPVSTYQVSLDQSVPFIGGDLVRGMFGPNDNRLTGEGIKVGVIDTGVDYTHPDLKENYSGGYDVVDNDADPMETKASGKLSTIHGTHVAGIIAANGKVKGVAPEAEIVGYRALGPGGVGTSEQVIAAIEKAIEDKVDVINLSLGNTVNGPDWPTSIALNKAVEKGIICVTSSGNAGPNVWTVGSPGTALKAISVGASTPPLKIPYIQVGGTRHEYQIQLLQGSKPWERTHYGTLVYGGLGYQNDMKDVEGKIVLVKRGEIPFTEKVKHAQAKGARAVLIYNNEKGNFSGSLQEPTLIPAASITNKAGKQLRNLIGETERSVYPTFKRIKDTVADFSSRGPVTHTWTIKPDVIAPGVAIKSTIPNGYLPLQGTSMAAPHVAGAAALIKQAHPNWTPQQVKAALMNTAEALKKPDGQRYVPYIQGAGRIRVEQAVQAETLIYPGSLAFGKVMTKQRRKQLTVNITIDNESDHAIDYRFQIPKNKPGLQWKLPLPFEVGGKQTKQVTLTLDIQPSVFNQGLHHGWIAVMADGEKIELPYLFVVNHPDYPRQMGFEFGKDPDTKQYKCKIYLPEGADDFSITLFDVDSYRFIKHLVMKKNVPRGTIEQSFSAEAFTGMDQGVYRALVHVSKFGKEDTLETFIKIGPEAPLLKE